MNPLQARLLDRAHEATTAARRAIAAGDATTAANRAYYAMFYAAWALVSDEPDVGRRHRAVHARFGERYARPAIVDPALHRWLLDAFEVRQLADYDPMTEVEPAIISETVDQAGEFVRVAGAILAPDP